MESERSLLSEILFDVTAVGGVVLMAAFTLWLFLLGRRGGRGV